MQVGSSWGEICGRTEIADTKSGHRLLEHEHECLCRGFEQVPPNRRGAGYKNLAPFAGSAKPAAIRAVYILVSLLTLYEHGHFEQRRDPPGCPSSSLVYLWLDHRSLICLCRSGLPELLA